MKTNYKTSIKLRTGIVGCGKVAHLHAKALKESKNSIFTAVCSRSAEKGRNFASGYGVRSYTSPGEMVKSEQLDIVVICTPHPFHKNPAVSSIESGAHVLIEKPLASTLSDCDSIIHAASKHGKKVGVVSQRRFYAPCQRVHNAIVNGKLGKPSLATVQMLGWRDKAYYQSDKWRGRWDNEGGGVLVNQAPHQLDLLQWFMGGDIAELYGVWSNINHPYIEVEDTAVAILKFKDGGIANIVVSNSQKPGIYGKVHVHGSNGASAGVQTDGGAMFIAGMSNVLEPPVNDIWTIPGEEKMLSEWVKEDSDFFNKIDPAFHYIKMQNEDFITAVIEDRDPLVPGTEGRKTVEIFTAIYRSQRDNLPVKWPLVPEYDRDDMDGRISV